MALDLIDKRYHKVVKMYLEKIGTTVNEIGHLTSSRINILVQLQKMGVSKRLYTDEQLQQWEKENHK